MITPAIFRDGCPENLPAAALDALEWLMFFRRYYGTSGEDRPRLNRAIDALEGELKRCLPEVELDCKCRRCAFYATRPEERTAP